ncbi:MAG: hypothetical protein ACOC7Y_01410 [Chloroflexota bacterium]
MASRGSDSRAPAVVDLQPHDDRTSLRYRLDAVSGGRVALRLPWDHPFLSRQLDFDVLRRQAGRKRLEVAIVSPDPERRQLARACGFAAFSTVEAARAAKRWNGHGPEPVAPPPHHWWEPEIDLERPRVRPQPTWLSYVKRGVRCGIFLLVVAVLAGSAYVIVPRAEVIIVPSGTTLSVTVPVSVDPEAERGQHLGAGLGGVIPSRRVGLEIEGSAEAETTGTASVAAGRATGEVLFTSLLAQDYVVPAGTIVRTSSTSYPIRFRTTSDVVVPADGQAVAGIEALDARTGNVGALQINRVDGVVGSAVRVINPAPTTGAEPTEVAVVTQADYDRVRERLTQELLNEAHYELHSLLEDNEFLPRQSLRVESAPKKAYSRFVGEQAETVGLNMRLLVSGQAVDIGAVEDIAYRELLQNTPSGHRLIDADFELGSVTEDEDGPGWFTVSVTGHGYAAAALSADQVVDAVRGQRLPDARAELLDRFPLAEPPQFAVWPEWPAGLSWLERMPLLAVRINVSVVSRSPLAAADS